MSVLVLGSSHVGHFRNYMRRHKHNKFNIENLETVNYCAISGGKINNSSHIQVYKEAIARHKPSCVIIQLGGNDLDSCDSDEDIEILVFRLVAVCKMFQRNGLQRIYVNQFIHRTKPRYTSSHVYATRVIKANRMLKEELKTDNSIFYWKIKGFADPVSEVFRDGVHLNIAGLHKYFRHVRGAILHFLQH